MSSSTSKKPKKNKTPQISKDAWEWIRGATETNYGLISKMFQIDTGEVPEGALELLMYVVQNDDLGIQLRYGDQEGEIYLSTFTEEDEQVDVGPQLSYLLLRGLLSLDPLGDFIYCGENFENLLIHYEAAHDSSFGWMFEEPNKNGE